MSDRLYEKLKSRIRVQRSVEPGGYLVYRPTGQPIKPKPQCPACEVGIPTVRHHDMPKIMDLHDRFMEEYEKRDRTVTKHRPLRVSVELLEGN